MRETAFRRFVRDNVVIAAGNLSSLVLSISLIPLVVRVSGTKVYGSYVLLSSMIQVAIMLSTLGIGYRYRRCLPSTDDPANRAEVFVPGVTAQSLAIALGTLMFLTLFPSVAFFFLKEPPGCGRTVVLAFALTYAFNSQATEYFRYTNRMMIMSLSITVANLLSLTALLVLAAVGIPLTLNLLFAVPAATSAAVGLVLWNLIRKEIPLRLEIPSMTQLFEDVRLGFPVIISGFSEMVAAIADRYVIGAWLSADAVGVYAPACALGSVVLFLPRILGVVLPPLLARAVDKSETHEGAALVRYSIRLFLLAGIPAIAGGALVAVPALQILANEHVAAEARHVVPLIAAYSLIYGVVAILNGVLFVERRTRLMLSSNLVGGAVKVILSILALRFQLGLTGVACAAVVGQVFTLLIVLWGATVPKRALFDPVFFLKLAAASLVMMVLIKALETPLVGWMKGPPLLATLVVSGICFYAAGLCLFGVFTPREWGFFKSVLSQRTGGSS